MLFFVACILAAPHIYHAPFVSMGTNGEFAAWVEDDVAAEKGFAAARAALERVNTLMRPWGDSELATLNASKGPMRVAPETFAVLSRAQEFSRESGGLFDVTFASMGNLWRFDGSSSLPADAEVKARRAFIDFHHLVLDPKTQTATLLGTHTEVGLGGIAKGFGIDQAVAALRANGVENFVIKLGGDLFAAGGKGDGKDAWRVGILDPRGSTPFAELEVRDHAFSTSGDYEHFFIAGNKRYHHIIDPRTGYPATASRSVTILAPDATTAEGLTKILFIAGTANAEKLLALHPGCEAVIVTADNHVWTSRGLNGRLRILHPPTE